MSQRDSKKNLLLIAFLMSLVGFSIAFNILMSQTDWWFWTESDGLVGIPIVVVSLPLILFSGIIRKAAGFSLKEFMDIFCCFIMVFLFGLAYSGFSHDVFNLVLVLITLVAICFLLQRIYQILRIMFKL